MTEPVELICSRCARNMGTTTHESWIAIGQNLGVWCSKRCMVLGKMSAPLWWYDPIYQPNADGGLKVTLTV